MAVKANQKDARNNIAKALHWPGLYTFRGHNYVHKSFHFYYYVVIKSTACATITYVLGLFNNYSTNAWRI